MKRPTAVLAFFRLIRWPNLFFIALTQSLFYFCIVLPSFESGIPEREAILQPREFGWLCLSSVLIAAAGYIINDYFDLQIDQLNKPQKVVVEKIIRRRWAIIWHWVLSGAGIGIGFYLSYRLRNVFIGPSNLACVLLLWFYSTTFKKKLLIGNLIISALTAWVIGILYLCEFRFHRFVDPDFHGALSRIYKFALLYGSFAFVISLVREVVKDLEDMKGDERYGRRTIPLVWGIPAARFICMSWLTLLLAALIFFQFYVLQFRWWFTIVYSLLLVIFPMIRVLKELLSASDATAFHELSHKIKYIMMMGILSMVLLKYYTSWIG